MLLEIRFSNETMPVDLLDGTIRVGGGPTDDICVEGLPPGLLSLRIDGERVTVTSARSVRIGASLFPANVARLVIEGEDVELPNEVVLRRPIDPKRAQQRREMGTAFVAKELLGDVVPTQTRAATLTCVTGGDAGTTWPLALMDCLMGRADDVDLRLRDRTVSRHHARLVRRWTSFLIEDLRTTNGVYVNGQRVKGRKRLETGDIIELGQTVLRFGGPERAPDERTAAVPSAPILAPALPPELQKASAAAAAALRVGPSGPDAIPNGVTPTFPLPRATRERTGLALWMAALGAVMAIAGFAISWAMIH